MLGEAMNNAEMENRVEIGNNTDESSSMQLGKNTINFSLYPQIGLREGIDRFVDLIPQLPSPLMNTFLTERYSSIDNQEKLTSLGPFGCPSDYTKTGITSNLTEVRSSFVHNFEGLPFDMNGRLELSKFITPQELDGRVVGLVNEWGMIEQTGLSSTRFSNELSLSLATSQCSEMNSLHNRPMVSEHTSCNSSSSYKPLQAPPLLSGSSFVQAMQEILAEIACYALENIDHGVNVPFGEDHTFMFQNKLLLEGDIEAKKKHLISLLQLVDDRYNQCVDEIHTVTSAFHAVTELDPNLHARFALPTISFMYKNLRERISNHILAIGADGETREEKSFETCFLQKQWALQQLSKRDHQFWRPQRGLPERSVSVLRAWMFQNFLHPYPKDAEKHLLALKSGLTRNQVSNWFINARVRLWKPMIEEMCAEMNKRKARRINEETEGGYRSHMCFDTRRFTMEKHG